MKKVLYIILISLFSLTVISCCSSSDSGSSTTSNTSDNDTTTTTDTTAPVISEVTVVTTPTSDTTPDYTFSSDEAGTITYGGSCSSSTTSATTGNNTITLVSLTEGTYSNCTITVTDSAGNVSNSLTITSFTVSTVSETTQTLGNDGYLTGSFVVPNDGISFLLSTFSDNNSLVGFYSLTDPDGTNILSSSSALYNRGTTAGYGYANVLVPQSPSFSAKAGTWTFINSANDRVKLVMRSDSTPSNATIVVQPYITGTTWSASDISEALGIMSNIYAKNGINLKINSTITISDSQYASVSGTATNSTTSALVSKGSTDTVNLFFVEDLSSGSYLGVATGIPGSMKMANSWNGVLNFLTPHATGSTLNSQLLGETVAHEMGHQLGLFHTSESVGTVFDILSDTPECAISRDSDSSGKVSAEECDGYGGDNLMFWTAWSSSSQAAGKKQETLSSYQQYVLKYSPIANQDTNPYVRSWVNSSERRIALDWKSDSFIYMCLVSDYTYTTHGSYSSSNSRLTWWDNSYNTVTTSGSNILLNSATYVPAVLTSACNPFWTNSSSENTYYTNAARSIGFWGFTYTISSTSYTDYLSMIAISSRRASDNNYYTYGIDYSGNIITGTYTTSLGVWDILDTSDSNYYQYYVFAMNSSNSGITSGAYYLYNVSTSSFSSAISMTGAKIYGTPRTYRTLNEKSDYETINEKHLQMLEVESKQMNSALTEKELQDFSRLKKLLQTLDSPENEPLKKYLRSFRTK
jgi:hypothetical protein